MDAVGEVFTMGEPCFLSFQPWHSLPYAVGPPPEVTDIGPKTSGTALTEGRLKLLGWSPLRSI